MFEIITSLVQKVGVVIGSALIAVGGIFGGQTTLEGRDANQDATSQAGIQVNSEDSLRTSEDNEIESRFTETVGVDEKRTETNKAENFNTTVALALDGQIEYNSDVVSYVEDIIAHVNNDLKRMEKVTRDTESIVAQYGSDTATNALLAYYRTDVSIIRDYMTTFAEGKRLLEVAGVDYQNRKRTASSRHITQQEAVTEIQRLQNDLESTSKMRVGISSHFDSYLDLRRESDSDIKMAFKLLESQSDVSYVPPPVYVAPVVQIPKTTSTRCTVSPIGDTISCSSYTY